MPSNTVPLVLSKFFLVMRINFLNEEFQCFSFQRIKISILAVENDAGSMAAPTNYESETVFATGFK
jgi:hypothetical protein